MTKKKPRWDEKWDHTTHQTRKKAKEDKTTKELMAQVYEALNVDPHIVYEDMTTLGGQVMRIPKFRAARGGITYTPPPVITGESGPETIVPDVTIKAWNKKTGWK